VINLSLQVKEHVVFLIASYKRGQGP
jgi:hypothetical protein